MSTQLGEAFVSVRATLDKLDQDLAGARSKIDGALGKIAKGAAGVAGAALAGGTAAMAGFATASVAAFVPFQEQMNEVFTLLPGISQSAMDDMTRQVLDLSREFGILPEEVVPALYQALSAGVPPDNVFAFLEDSAKASIGGVTNLTSAVDAASSVVNAYGADVISVTEANDLMFTAVKQGKTTYEELKGSLFNVIPTAAALGVGFDQVTASMATMTAQGVPTSVASTQLRQLLVELSKEGGAASKAFEEAAGVGFAEFIAQGGNLNDALGIMQGAAGDAGQRITDLFGSVEAGNAALQLTGPASDRFAANLEAMANSSGATNAAFETMDAGIGRALEKAAAFGQTLLLTTGQSLAPLIEKLVELGQSAMPMIQDVMTRAQPIFEAFATELGDKIGPATTIIVDAINRMAQALGLTNENMSGSDMLLKGLKVTLDLIITAVEATAVAFELIAQATEAVRGAFDAANVPISAFNDIVGGLLNPIGQLQGAWDNLVASLSQPITIPDWLVPGSPTPLELGIQGISRAIEQMPDFSSRFEVGAPSFPALAGAGIGGGGNTTIVNVDGVSVTTTGVAGDPLDAALADAFDLLKARLKGRH